MDDNEQTCPACGKPDSELPAGHMLSTPLDGGEPSCQALPPPRSRIIDDWLWAQRIAPPGGRLIQGLPEL